jgi:hypothetical protein
VITWVNPHFRLSPGLILSYCFDSPTPVFEAVEKIKINPTGKHRRAENWFNKGISKRRCPNGRKGKRRLQQAG